MADPVLYFAEEKIKELIYRRRQQVWVHSILYYRMNTNLVSDDTWSKWALELENLQRDYPKLAEQVPYHDIFKDFDHSTGSNLPDSPCMVAKAQYLLDISNKCEKIKAIWG